MPECSRSANRLKAAEEGVANAAETAEKNLRGLVPGKRIGDQLTLVFRPQEAVAAVAALDQAYRDYYAAVADQNRAQFQLYRALGNPAQCLTIVPTRPAPTPTMPAPVPPAPAPVPAPALLPGPASAPAASPVVQPSSHTAPVPTPLTPPVAEEPVWQAAGSPQLTAPVPVSVYPPGQSPRRP